MNSAAYAAIWGKYIEFRDKKVKVNMARGCPSEEQLDLSTPMLDFKGPFFSESGEDVRNYGSALGIPEARRLFGEILDVPPEQVIVGGSSSLNMLYDFLTRAWIHGVLPGTTPWGKLPKVKFICPQPGYDWHFKMLEMLGILCIPVDMLPTGPDLKAVARLAADPTVKGIICNPQYSNPTGITYSDDTVRFLASLKTASDDFRILWDNAYAVHHLYPEEEKRDHLLNILTACKEAGNPERAVLFASTSKITYAGGGMACMAGGEQTIARTAELLRYQLVCYDRTNQLRHVRFLPDKAAVEAHMAKHAAILRPRFEKILACFEAELKGLATWSSPRGGYFIAFRGPNRTARRIVALAEAVGVTLTPAGAPFVGGIDTDDAFLRIAPTRTSEEELDLFLEIFPTIVRIAAYEVGVESTPGMIG